MASSQAVRFKKKTVSARGAAGAKDDDESESESSKSKQRIEAVLQREAP